MRTLGLDAALTHASAAVVVEGVSRGACSRLVQQGQPSALPAVVAAALQGASVPCAAIDLIAVTIGPGSFTGIRSALAFAQGLGVALGIPVIGVTVGEALNAAGQAGSGRAPWCAIDNRRGLIFLERPGAVSTVSLRDLPQPDGPVSISGDAAGEVASRLAAQGHDVLLTDRRVPTAFDVARAGEARLREGRISGRLAPLYVDQPAVRPAGPSLRSAPGP